MPEDNVTDYVGVIDERIHNYKGIQNRLNFGHINDRFDEIPDDNWLGENIFSPNSNHVNANTWYKENHHEYQRQEAVKPFSRISKKLEELELAKRYIIEHLDPNDGEYIEQKKLWRKDATHFDYLQTFKQLNIERTKRF